MKKVKWGIIGCGDVTEIKSGPAFNLIENSELVAVMRRDADKAKDYALRHNVPKWYSDANELMNDSEVNAIYVATPPDTHAVYTIQALNAKMPVYVEKPMALSYEETRQMVEASNRNQAPLFVAFYRRALPLFRKVKELVENGEIGAIRCINIQLFKAPTELEKKGELGWRVNPEIAGAGYFFDLASHQLDYLDYVFGPVKEVVSFVRNQAGIYSAEDFISASFAFNNNIVCSGTWCFSASPESDRDSIEIIGDKGTIKLSCFEFKPIVLRNTAGVQSFDIPNPKHIQHNLIKEVVEDLLGISKSSSTGESASRTSWVLDQVVKEYYSKKN